MKAGFFRNAAWVTVALAGGAAGLYLFFRFALPVLTPFLFALLLAVLTRPLVRKISACLGGHEKLSAAGVTLFFLCLFGVLCYFLVLLLVTQAQNLLEMLLRDAADENGKIYPVCGDTGIFIYPGYRFRAVDALITNFHLPESTLLMLVSAFYDREHIMEAYRTAVAEKYRFFSFGDAMLIQ